MKRKILLLAAIGCFICKSNSQTVSDYDGNIYDTVTIGTQVWMKQNLQATHYNDGTAIPNVTGSGAWSSLNTGARCYYNNDSAANASVYGALYNWYVVSNSSHICPTGWHVSSNAEWLSLETYLGGAGVAGGETKEAGILHWTSPNTGATNNSNYTGLPGGMRDPVNYNFRTINENGLWWTSTSYNSTMAYSTYMWYLNAGIDHNPGSKRYGFSIRCLKDLNTSLGEALKADNFTFYPNPASDKITLNTDEPLSKNIQITSMTGTILLQCNFSSPENVIDISSLSKGVYILKMNTETGITQQKLIKN